MFVEGIVLPADGNGGGGEEDADRRARAVHQRRPQPRRGRHGEGVARGQGRVHIPRQEVLGVGQRGGPIEDRFHGKGLKV